MPVIQPLPTYSPESALLRLIFGAQETAKVGATIFANLKRLHEEKIPLVCSIITFLSILNNKQCLKGDAHYLFLTLGESLATNYKRAARIEGLTLPGKLTRLSLDHVTLFTLTKYAIQIEKDFSEFGETLDDICRNLNKLDE